jgi:hypothetical protein
MPEKKLVLVFGSNTDGIHGAGAALYAKQNEGAIEGQGHGRQGNSYALATRTTKPGHRWIVDLPFEEVKKNVATFIQYAKDTPEDGFKVTQIGTGHAGFTHEQMAPLFADAPDNCYFDTAWKPWLGESKHYWGTY